MVIALAGLAIGFAFGPGLAARARQWQASSSLANLWDHHPEGEWRGMTPAGSIHALGRADLRTILLSCNQESSAAQWGQAVVGQITPDIQVIIAPKAFRWAVGGNAPMAFTGQLARGDDIELQLKGQAAQRYRVLRTQATQEAMPEQLAADFCQARLSDRAPQRLILLSELRGNPLNTRRWLVRVVAERIDAAS